MKRLEYTECFTEELDVRFVIVDKKTGKINEPVIRCVTNFSNYVLVGTLICRDNFDTYVLPDTPNIKATSFTVGYNDEEANEKHGVAVDYTREEINKEITQRAKDLIFGFKG